MKMIVQSGLIIGLELGKKRKKKEVSKEIKGLLSPSRAYNHNSFFRLFARMFSYLGRK